jgi:poly(A) polymerase
MTPRLDPQPWMLAPETRRVMDALTAERPGCARFVGGCVRNALLGEPVADIDIATQLAPDVVARVCRDAGLAVHPTGIEHGTVTVVANHAPFEVTTLRRDVETDGRRATVAFTEDWTEDAQRRDFRINALYASADGDVFDPTGGGLEDARLRRVVFVGEAETRIREDYLRILRFFRFNAWYAGEAPDADGLAACGRLKDGLSGISVERIWMEMRKLLAAPAPMEALRAMAATGVLGRLFPEAHGLDLVEALVRLERSEGATPDPLLRFLALFPLEGELAASVARRLKMSNEERDRLVFAAREASPMSPPASPEEARATLYRIGHVAVLDRAMLAWAAEPAAGASWRALVDVARTWPRPSMPVSGEDVMARGVPGGPEVGAALRRLEAAWIASDFTEGRESLLARL